VNVKGASFLVITSSIGVYIWSSDGTSMIFFLAVRDIIKDDSDFQFMRGIAGNSGSIFVGTSCGDLVEISIAGTSEKYDIEHSITINVTTSPITCLTVTDTFLICGNDNGDVKCFQTTPHIHDNPLFSRSGYQYPCTCIIANNDTIIAGFSTGHLRGYRISTGDLVVEVAAHVRCVTGLALHPYGNLFASCSEDQYLCVWNFSDLSSRSYKHMELVSSEKLDNRLCTGICYFEDDRIGITAYDEEDVAIFQRLP
jgi:WD40 repeat protein